MGRYGGKERKESTIDNHSIVGVGIKAPTPTPETIIPGNKDSRGKELNGYDQVKVGLLRIC